jgi:large subunit ribosomal protein L30
MADEEEKVVKAAKKTAVKKAATKKAVAKKAVARKAAPKAEAKVVAETATPKAEAKVVAETAAPKAEAKVVAETAAPKAAPKKAAAAKADSGVKRLSVTLVRSRHGRLASHKACVAGLGLRRMHQTVQVIDTPENRGMINKVQYMLNVEEA